MFTTPVSNYAVTETDILPANYNRTDVWNITWLAYGSYSSTTPYLQPLGNTILINSLLSIVVVFCSTCLGK